jgi:tetratricopeptide (TPR) repeat protein
VLLIAGESKKGKMADSSASTAAETLKAEGNQLFKDGQFKQAIRKYREAILLSPSAALHTNRAACYIKLNKLRDAIEDCKEAIELDKTWARAYVRKAEAHLQLEEHMLAVVTLRQGLKVIPSSEEMKNLMAKAKMAELQNERLEDVRNCFVEKHAFCFCLLASSLPSF